MKDLKKLSDKQINDLYNKYYNKFEKIKYEYKLRNIKSFFKKDIDVDFIDYKYELKFKKNDI